MNNLVARRIIADKYRLERALAAGGMGSVWSAWNTQLDVPVAIKFMAPAMVSSVDLVARFEREARAAAQLRSSHVVQIYEHGVDDGLPFIVMELLEGEDLGQRMRRVGRMPLADTARIVASVCKALRRAHAIGIVHRDLKPANVFLARGDEDDEEVIKVLDFGVVKSLAEAVESGVTKTGELIGTPNYMSPEQARSTKTVDHRSDLWSLGIISYRALTATLPFPDDEGIERLMRICSEPIPPPSTYAPDLCPEVDAFFAKALAMDPEERFQTAREMADALAFVAGVPVSSRSGSRSYFPSHLDLAPLSGGAYTAQAYVYTSPADADDGRDAGSPGHGAGRRRSALAAAARSSSSPPSSRAPGSLAGRAPSPTPTPASPVEQPTRVSGVDAVQVRAPSPVRPPPAIAQVASPVIEITPPSTSPLGVAHEISTSGGVVARSYGPSGSPRWRILLGALATAALLAAAGLALSRRADPAGAEASPAAGRPPVAPEDDVPPAAASAVIVTPAQSAAATAPPRSPAPSDDPASASSAAASATASALAAPSSRAAAPPKKLYGPKPVPTGKAGAHSKSEGGLGRRPTY